MTGASRALFVPVCLSAALFGACATHRVSPAGERAVPLEDFVQKVRQLSSQARPPRTGDAETLEKNDIELSIARLLLSVTPSAENHRRVANEYWRLGVLDLAYDHFAAAVRLNRCDGSSLDGLARIWRAWGFPNLGLDDASRAIACAPDSPVPPNTLGTLLLKMGRVTEARSAFERALALDPHAAYALNNVCYASLLLADARRAVETCHAALEAEPTLKAARNNLALAYAASGDFTGASREFSLASGEAAAQYNMGIALMATRHFGDAAVHFDEAAALLPSPAKSRSWAREARRLAATTAGSESVQ